MTANPITLLRKFAGFMYRDLGTRSTAIVVAAFVYTGHLVFQGKVAPSELGAGFALLFLTTATIFGEAKWSLHILCYPLVLYGVASSAAALAAPAQMHAFAENMLWIKMATFPTALALFRIAPALRRWALAAHAFLLAFLSLRGIYEYFVLDRRDLENRITGGVPHVMTYSGLILPLTILFSVLWVHRRRWWMGGAAILGSFALLLTYTRSAWVAWLAAMFTLILLSRLRQMSLAVPLLIIFVTVMPLPMFERLLSSFDLKLESNLDRIRMIGAGVEIIRDHPILGVGPANIKAVYPFYRAPDAPRARTPHLHNNVVQIWAERGILALIAYLLLFGLFFRECAKGWQTRRPFAEAGVGVAVALLVAGLFEFNFGDTEVFYLTLDLFALVVAEMEAPVEVEVDVEAARAGAGSRPVFAA